MLIEPDDSYVAYANIALQIAAFEGVLANDPVGAEIGVQLKRHPLHGSIELNRDGSFRYVPEVGFAGADEFTYHYVGPTDLIEERVVRIEVEGDLTARDFDLQLPGYGDRTIHGDTVALLGGLAVQVHLIRDGDFLLSQALVYGQDGLINVVRGNSFADLGPVESLGITDNNGFKYAAGEIKAIAVDADTIAVRFSGAVSGLRNDSDATDGIDDSASFNIDINRVDLINIVSGNIITLYTGELSENRFDEILQIEQLGEGRLALAAAVTTLTSDDLSTESKLDIYSFDGTLQASYDLGDDTSVRLVALPDGGALIQRDEQVDRLTASGDLQRLFDAPGTDGDESSRGGSNIALVGNDRFALVYSVESEDEDEYSTQVYELRSFNGELIKRHEYDLDAEDVVGDIISLDNGVQLVAWTSNNEDATDETQSVVFGQLYAMDGSELGDRISFGRFHRPIDEGEPGPLVVTDGRSFLVLAGPNTGYVVGDDGTVNFGPFRLTGEDQTANVVRAEALEDQVILLQWGDGSRYIRLPDGGDNLFSPSGDLVDFNSLTPKQLTQLGGLVSEGRELAIYDALAGADTIVLPDKDSYELLEGLVWDPMAVFHSGPGEDMVEGGDGADLIKLGSEDDILIGSIGSDVVEGEDGADSFDYSGLDLALLERGTRIDLDGGTHPDETPHGLQIRPDLLTLPGQAADYDFSVSFIGYAAGQKPQTQIASRRDADSFRLDTVGIEQVLFPDGEITNRVSATNLLVEMARLASEAYGPLPTLEHTAEPLRSEFGADDQTIGVTAAAVGRSWHPVAAIELGMAAADKVDGLHYSFEAGHYQSKTPSQVFRGDTPEANAIVLTGVIDGKRTLAIAFRGTDQISDFSDYLDFSTHYSKFSPLIAAIDAFVGNPANGIEQVVVSGHSLGAGMTQEFMATHLNGDVIYKALTVGSPGNDRPSMEDDRIINLAHTQDLVPPLGKATQLQPVIVAALAAIDLGIPAALIDLQPKFIDGSQILINTDASSFIGISEHDRGLYLTNLVSLLENAIDFNSLFASSDLARSILQSRIYDGPIVQVALPDTSRLLSDTITSKIGDDFVIGSSRADRIRWTFDTDLGGKASIDIRHIDGGQSKDLLYLPGNPLSWDWTENGRGFELTYRELVAGQLHRVERLVFLDIFSVNLTIAEAAQSLMSSSVNSTMSSPVISLDGTPVVAQYADLDATSVQVDVGADYLDAGDGDVTITGSTAGDVVVLGFGNQSFQDDGGSDVILAKLDGSRLATGVLTVTGGAGDDYIAGDPGFADRVIAVFSGSRADYRAEKGDDGSIRIADIRLGSPDGVDRLRAVDRFQFIDGELDATTLLSPNALVGPVAKPGQTIIHNTVAAEVLAGGDGQDIFLLDMGSPNGNDRIAGFGTNDLVVTTRKLFDSDNDGVIRFGKNKALDLSDSSGVASFETQGGRVISRLEFDGPISHSGIEYFVYSAVGSMAGTADLYFE